MKINHLIFLLFFTAAFASCDGDDDPSPNILPDAEAPQVNIIVPEANDSILLIDVMEVLAELTDNMRLENMRVILTDNSGSSRVLSDFQLELTSDLKNVEMGQALQIPQDAAVGDYTVRVEARDYGKNVGKDSVAISFYASNVSNETFRRPTGNALIFSHIAQSLQEAGFSYWDNGYSFDDVWFSKVLHLMVSTDDEAAVSEAEWNRFIEDFGIKDQTWAAWDADSDGNLTEAEFYQGLMSLDLFNEWDENQDAFVGFEEMSDGIFAHWDLNQDDLLTMEEYLDKFYTYFYR